ncbi:deoxyribose-phosphate aldolase [Rubrobacter marinus]|uniref:Deoxyribose-phosphate aldolase n=1 Tax=Rubrobacter marinus TaxID=2653852 RepID=A0A6G8PXF7_9ACTN|nr:deoxyribose-phosphate aldolase [Rubrobacter marinus]QIN78817.1 deoxyribose-phosphate aldolase [Rubrobacter marinus]
MRVREFAKTVDHTLLKPNSTEAEVRTLCEEAARYHFAAVCILPCHVRLAAKALRGTDVKVATVVSFPFGADTTGVKAAAVRDAIVGGASEIDVVMNISKFLSGEFSYVAEELASLNGEVSAVAMNNGLNDAVLKVIIEAGYLTDEMKRLAVQIVAASGADFVKTSTGFGPGGATPEDVSLLREEAPEGLSVKASGGIRSLEDAIEMLNAGASRLGTSGSVAIMEEAENGGLQE